MTQITLDLDLLSIGEILIDFITTETTESLENANSFYKFQGGSPANLAVNVTKLGGCSALVAKAGEDGFGRFLVHAMKTSGVDTSYLTLDSKYETSLVFVARTSGTPDFQAYRSADYQLYPENVPNSAIERAKIIHTTTWPLSRNPSRETVLWALKQACGMGKIVSFDPNYSPRIWPDHQEAIQVITEALRSVTHLKASLDDAHRFFGEGKTPEEYIQEFHMLGPGTVVFTQGKSGSIVSENGKEVTRLQTRSIKVVDATGAGDSFWSGFLMALVDGNSLERCLKFAREVVEIKLQTVGPLQTLISRHELYKSL